MSRVGFYFLFFNNPASSTNLRGAAVAQKVEDQAEALAVAVEEDRAVLGVSPQHVDARAEHRREHRLGNARQRRARGIVPHAADVEPEAVLA